MHNNGARTKAKSKQANNFYFRFFPLPLSLSCSRSAVRTVYFRFLSIWHQFVHSLANYVIYGVHAMSHWAIPPCPFAMATRAQLHDSGPNNENKTNGKKSHSNDFSLCNRWYMCLFFRFFFLFVCLPDVVFFRWLSCFGVPSMFDLFGQIVSLFSRVVFYAVCTVYGANIPTLMPSTPSPNGSGQTCEWSSAYRRSKLETCKRKLFVIKLNKVVHLLSAAVCPFSKCGLFPCSSGLRLRCVHIARTHPPCNVLFKWCSLALFTPSRQHHRRLC